VARCQQAMSHGGLLSGPAHSRYSRRSCAGFTTAAAKTQAAVSAPYGTARVKDGCLGRPSDDDDRRGFVGLAELRLCRPRKEFVTITYAAPISLGERGAEEIACAPTDKRSPLCTKFSAENDLQRQLAAFGNLYGLQRQRLSTSSAMSKPPVRPAWLDGSLRTTDASGREREDDHGQEID
jgi:hypothetical protein